MRRIGVWAAVFGLWAALAIGLEALTTRVVDWYYMTDELLYERLAVSIARTGSLLPMLHGRHVPVLDQLYPLLIAPAYRHGLVPGNLHQAHAVNAWVMSSAAIPAFLLARRVTRAHWPAFLVALLTVCVPWIVYSSFLLTEVAAYPAFLWAMLAFQAAAARQSARNDVLVLLGIALAVLARTQFVVLLLALPVALVVNEGWAAPKRHRVLAWAYAALGVLIVTLAASGRGGGALGLYGETVHGDVVPPGVGRALLDHVAVLALGLAILPFLVGVAWLLAAVARPGDAELRAFAAVALVTTTLIVLEGALFDVRYGYGSIVVRDRYLFYAGPLVVLAFLCALRDAPRSRWALAATALVVTAGFAVVPVPDYGRLDVGSPAAAVIVYVRDGLHSVTGTRIFLACTAVIVALLYVEGRALLRAAHLAAVAAALVTAAFVVETDYVFRQLFDHPGTSGRPVTLQQGGVFDWVDRTVGPAASVTMVPYPTSQTDVGASTAFWWDLELWNESVMRDAHYPGQFEGTPSTFPKDSLHFDAHTGRANGSLTRYVAESAKDSRFRLSGDAVSLTRDTLLIDAERPWRTDWLTFGLFPDGWTKPGGARIRVFAATRQAGARQRWLGISVQAPFAPTLVSSEPFELVSNLGRWKGVTNGVDDVKQEVTVCVPAGGFADIRFGTYGRTFDVYANGQSRTAGALITGVAMADEIGPRCT